MKHWLWIVGVMLLAVIVTWLLVRPGVFVVQPLGAIPSGGMLVYYARGPEMPFITSADGLCLHYMGSVSLLCRGTVLAGVTPLTERVIVRLPYSRTAYLWSTGGKEFDR